MGYHVDRDFLASFEYAKSEMVRAITAAGQFAHVCERDIDAFMAWAEINIGHKATCLESKVIPHYPRVFKANYLLSKFEEWFGHLCPVCYTVIGADEPRGRYTRPYETMPSWLYYKGEYFHDYCHAHELCALGIKEVMNDLDGTLRGNLYHSNQLMDFFRRGKRAYRWFWDEIEKRRLIRPPLRFDPSLKTDHFYEDTRYVRDMPDEEVEAFFERIRREQRRKNAARFYPPSVGRRDLANSI